MKITKFVLSFGFALFLASAALAQTNFWQGTVGTTTSQWSNTATWSTATVPDSQGAIVSFSADFTSTATGVNIAAGTNYTVGVINMTDTTTSSAGKFNILGAGSSATLTLNNGASVPVINYTTGGQYDNFINVTLAGTNGFQKTGTGVVQLNPGSFTNTYTGLTKISAGGLRFGKNSQLGDPAVGSGLELAGGILYVRPDAGTFSLDNGGSAQRSVSVTAGTAATPSRIQVEGTSSMGISGHFSSTAGTYFRKVDVGTLVFSGTANAIGRLEFDVGTTTVSGSFTNTEGMTISKNNTAGASSTVNWSGNGVVATGAFSTLLLNDGGTSVSNSRLNVTGTLNVGDGSNSGRFIVGGKGTGTTDINGGTLSVKANKEVSIGSFVQYGGSNGNGTLTISNGGLFQALGAGNFFVGYGQDSTAAGGAFGGTGVLNVNTGGTLETGRSIMTGTNATGTVNFNGGTLKAAADNANLLRTTNNLIGNGGLTVDTAGFSIGISNALSTGGAGGLTKTGAGTLILAAANTYSGGTTVAAGTLTVNNTSGSGTGSGALTINSGATLGGSGFIGSATTVGGTHAPGNSPGLQTFSNGLTYLTGATFVWELTANADTVRGTDFDGVDVSGGSLTINSGVASSLVFNAAGSSVDWGDAFWGSNQSWLVFDNASAPTGLFDSITAGLDSQGNSQRAGSSFSWSTTGNDIYLNYTVPEPSTYALLALGAATLTICSLRRRRSSR